MIWGWSSSLVACSGGDGGRFNNHGNALARNLIPAMVPFAAMLAIIAVARQPFRARRRRQFAATMARGVFLMGKDSKASPAGGHKKTAGKAEDRKARKAAALRENLRKRKVQQRKREEKPD
jgi:hypothetical protein